MISGEVAREATNLDPRAAVGLGMEQVFHRHPGVIGDFDIPGDDRTLRQDEDIRSHHERREMRGSGSDVVERPDQVMPFQPDSHLFGRLTNRRDQEILVPHSESSARQAHLPGPRVAGSLRPANEKDGIGVGHQDDRHGGAGEGGIVFGARRP